MNCTRREGLVYGDPRIETTDMVHLILLTSNPIKLALKVATARMVTEVIVGIRRKIRRTVLDDALWQDMGCSARHSFLSS